MPSLKIYLSLSILSILTTVNIGYGQSELSNLYQIRLSSLKDTIIFTEGSIIANSVTINPARCMLENSLQIGSKSLKYSPKASCKAKNDSITLSYRLFPNTLEQKYCLIDSSKIIMNDRVIDIAYDLGRDNNEDQAIIASKKMDYRGSFSRGLAVGNSQDLVLNSNFDMTLQGDLGGGLQIKGVISDDNIPIQAEGNTQQLREFDKVYIELSKDRSFLKAGDYVLKEEELYFSRYFKKLQGASLGHSVQIADKEVLGDVSYAVSRGKFARQSLNVTEGNQGPYKLTGNDGERFLIVLSGTERVYSDGKLLKRGEQYDYIIDYNSAEVEFTINHIINAFSRIIIEYEYTDQNFLRTLYAGEVGVYEENWDFGINFYSEQDNTSIAGFAELDSTRLNILSASGDDPNQSVISGIFIPEPDDVNAVFYNIRIDPVNNFQFLEYVDERGANSVGANFSEVEINAGEYIIDEEIAINQRVYKYVGQNQGNYSPIIKLITPKQKQLINVFGNYKIGENSSIGAEMGISRNDINRFSDIDNGDNNGTAFVLKHKQNNPLTNGSNWSLSTLFSAEYKKDNFVALNPYRAQEFNRIWSLDQTREQYNELLGTASATLSFKNKFKLQYQYNHFSQFENYLGNKNFVSINWDDKNWDILASTDLLNAESKSLKSQFYIPSIAINNKYGEDGWTYGLYYNKDQNKRVQLADNQVEDLSAQFERMGAYFGKKITEKLESEIAINKRNDWGILNDKSDFGLASQTLEYKLNVNWKQSKWSDLNINTTYRDLQIVNTEITTADANASFFGRINYNLNLLNQGIRSETLYETGSGQEAKQEYRYLMVQQGEGSYIWNDYNLDSIQQVNEFEIAPFGDLGNFERFVVFNNEFIRTAKTEFRQLLDIRPSKFISSDSKNLKWMKMLFWRSRYHLLKKTSGSNNRFTDSFNFSLDDIDIVTFGNNFDHTLFINQGSPVFNAEVGIRNNQNRIVLISGFEERQRSSRFAQARYNIKKKVDISLEGEQGNSKSFAENYEAKNFNVGYYEITPKVVVRMNKSLRWSLAYSYLNQTNITGPEVGVSKDFGGELTWRRLQKSNLNARMNFVINEFSGERGSPVELEMLQGLTIGNNWVWSLNYTQRIKKSIDATISYNGRKSGINRTVHTFSAQMKILF